MNNTVDLLASCPVVARFTRTSVQIMSDVWADISYAVVLLATGGYENVIINNSEFPRTEKLAFIDATPEQKAAYVAYKAAVEAKDATERTEREAAKRCAEVEAEARRVRYGKTVRVVKGRKVPVGTVGRIMWIGDGKWGERCGIAVNGERGADGRYSNVVWTATSNCEVIEDAEIKKAA